jgi:hypothetical protein
LAKKANIFNDRVTRLSMDASTKNLWQQRFYHLTLSSS